MSNGSFRYKPIKNKPADKIGTLDEVYRQQAKKFEDARLNLSKKKSELSRTLEEYDKLQSVIKPTEEMINRKLELKTRITNLSREVNDVSSGSSELDYYSHVDDILMTYYDVVDGKNTSDSPEEYTTSVDQIHLPEAKRVRKRNKSNSPNKNILQFFVQKPTETVQSVVDNSTETPETIDELPKNRQILLDMYSQLVDSKIQKHPKNVANYCDKCKMERVLFQNEGMYTCPSCCEVQIALIESEIHNYKDTITDKPSYPYKRYNHLSESVNTVKK